MRKTTISLAVQRTKNRRGKDTNTSIIHKVKQLRKEWTGCFATD